MKKYMLIVLTALVAFGSMNIQANESSKVRIVPSKKAYIVPAIEIAFGAFACVFYSFDILALKRATDDHCENLELVKQTANGLGNKDLQDSLNKMIDGATVQLQANKARMWINNGFGVVAGAYIILDGIGRIRAIRRSRAAAQRMVDAWMKKRAETVA